MLEIYEEVRREGARADQALQRVLRREKQLRSVERRAVSDAVYGLLRLQGRVDHLLQRALATRKLALEKLATPTQHLLRYAAYLIAGERQSAESAAGLAGPEVSQWQWALTLVAEPEALGVPQDPLDALAAETSLPRWLAKLWSEQLGAAGTHALAAALNQRAPLTVRANLLKNTRDELLATLRNEGSRVAPTRFSPWGVTFTGRTNVFALRAFKTGLFEVQDEGSQLIALACEARPGQVVVDACAGAGGKTLALASEMHNKGRLIACDRDGRRLDELRPRARRAGVHNWEARSVPESSNARIDMRSWSDLPAGWCMPPARSTGARTRRYARHFCRRIRDSSRRRSCPNRSGSATARKSNCCRTSMAPMGSTSRPCGAAAERSGLRRRLEQRLFRRVGRPPLREQDAGHHTAAAT